MNLPLCGLKETDKQQKNKKKKLNNIGIFFANIVLAKTDLSDKFINNFVSEHQINFSVDPKINFQPKQQQ